MSMLWLRHRRSLRDLYTTQTEQHHRCRKRFPLTSRWEMGLSVDIEWRHFRRVTFVLLAGLFVAFLALVGEHVHYRVMAMKGQEGNRRSNSKETNYTEERIGHLQMGSWVTSSAGNPLNVTQTLIEVSLEFGDPGTFPRKTFPPNVLFLKCHFPEWRFLGKTFPRTISSKIFFNLDKLHMVTEPNL